MIQLYVPLILVALASAANAAPPAHVKVGDPLPAFTGQTLSGQTISPATIKNKVVLINFFATWCGPCLTEMPNLQKEIFARHQR